jgi:tight adherence protein B
MMDTWIIPIAAPLLIGLSVFLLMYAMRWEILALFRRHVARIEHMKWRLSPEPYDGRTRVLIHWIFVVVTPIIILLFLPLKLILLAFWAVGAVMPTILLDREWQKRRKLLNDQLPKAVLQLSSGVASGMSLVQAIERIAERGEEPLRTEFRIVANYWNMGSDFTSTIEEAKRRLDLQDFTLFASALVINQRMGGNVVKTLERLALSLEAVDRMRKEVYSATSEGRTNIKVLAVAPFIMLGFTTVIDAQAVGWLFTRPFGQFLLLVAVLLTAAGTFWAWRIVNADV